MKVKVVHWSMGSKRPYSLCGITISAAMTATTNRRKVSCQRCAVEMVRWGMLGRAVSEPRRKTLVKPDEKISNQTYKLIPELIPEPLWGRSASQMFKGKAIWTKRIRGDAMARSGNKCVICGASNVRLLCHDIFQYDTIKGVPSGPGDVALVFAFIESVKPSSGFRFTESERSWIIGSRGLIDAAQAKINQGYEGTVLSPEQRQHMAEIIKSAADQADKQRNSILGAVGQINPTAAGLAGGGAPPAPAKPGQLMKKAKQNVDSGVSDDQFLMQLK